MLSGRGLESSPRKRWGEIRGWLEAEDLDRAGLTCCGTNSLMTPRPGRKKLLSSMFWIRRSDLWRLWRLWSVWTPLLASWGGSTSCSWALTRAQGWCKVQMMALVTIMECILWMTRDYCYAA